MKRALIVGYAAVAYAWFLVDMGWAVAFLAGVPAPTAIGHGHPGSPAAAVAVDVALLLAFALPHSVLARESTKRALSRVVPPAAERATYVLVADAFLALLLWRWRPFGGPLWDVPGQPWRGLLWGGYALGWVVAVAATFMIDHFDFVGLRQAASRPGAYRPPTFRERWLYARVRHPLMLGLLLAFWITPTMGADHLLFAAVFTGYIAVGVVFEERDLRRHLGAPYQEYARRTPAIVPRPWRRRSPVRHGGPAPSLEPEPAGRSDRPS